MTPACSRGFPPPESAADPLEVDREESHHLQLQPSLENIPTGGFRGGLTPRQLLHSLSTVVFPSLCDGKFP